MAREWIGEQGYLTFALNKKDTNYLAMAYLLAESIKDTQKINNISLAIDHDTAPYIKTKHEKMFDRIIMLGKREAVRKDFAHEARTWDITPYKCTIKAEADMLFTHSVDHWWPILDERDVVFTTDVFKIDHTVATNRSQRRLFDDNDLPNVYNALYYFRYTAESKRFFDIVKRIFAEWAWFRDHLLVNCRYEDPVADEVFAIAVRIFGEELCTLPQPVPAFIHMKNPLLEIPNDAPWWEYLYWERSGSDVRIGNYQQHLPVHYHNKLFLEKIDGRR
jgi:hypothetical protein